MSEVMIKAMANQKILAECRCRRVAILLFDDVEVLDFAGPFEVFSVTKSPAGDPAFEVVTVTLHGQEIAARGNLQIVPTTGASELANFDILVVPGGYGARLKMARAEMIDFIRSAAGRADVILSVCTGALLLGKAGLLQGQAADNSLGSN